MVHKLVLQSKIELYEVTQVDTNYLIQTKMLNNSQYKPQFSTNSSQYTQEVHQEFYQANQSHKICRQNKHYEQNLFKVLHRKKDVNLNNNSIE